MHLFTVKTLQKIPLKPYVDFSVIYYIKWSVVAIFSVNPMYSVNPMSVKVMYHCIFVPCEELSIEAFVPIRQRRVAFCGMTNANDLHQFRVQTPSFLISDGSSEVSLKCPAVPFYDKCQTRLAKVSAMP